MLVVLNGKFVQADQAKVSVFDHGFLYGDGVYETLRTYNGKVWGLSGHLKRLNSSAKRLGLVIPFNQQKVPELISELLERNGFAESRIRITVTRGRNDYDFFSCKRPTLLIHAVPLTKVTPQVYQTGVDVMTVNFERIAPEAKTISLLPLVLANREMKKKKVYEAVFVDRENFAREGATSNLFIIKGNILMTPKTRILKGITRSVILKLGGRADLRVKAVDFKKRQLYGADEVFITNTTKGIVPVRSVDGKKIGCGKPGSFTKKIRELFDGYIQKNIGR